MREILKRQLKIPPISLRSRRHRHRRDKPLPKPEVLKNLMEMMDSKDPELLSRVVRQFIHDAGACVEAMQRAIDADQADGMAKEAHGLKGISRNIGAGRLAELCAQLEQLGKSRDLEGIEKQLIILQQEFARVTDILEAELRQLSS